MLLLTLFPACALSAAYLSYAFSPFLAAKHLLLLGLVGALLVETSLYNSKNSFRLLVSSRKRKFAVCVLDFNLYCPAVHRQRGAIRGTHVQ